MLLLLMMMMRMKTEMRMRLPRPALMLPADDARYLLEELGLRMNLLVAPKLRLPAYSYKLASMPSSQLEPIGLGAQLRPDSSPSKPL